MYSDQAIHQLQSLPLTEVMRANGYAVHHRTTRNYFYLCPFHTEKDASFAVELAPKQGERYAGFHCFACGDHNTEANGRGAITLQQRLNKRDVRCGKDDFRLACDTLAKMFNLVLDGDYKNGWQHRNELVDAQPCASFEVRTEWTHAELRALGCQVHQVFARTDGHRQKDKHTGDAADIALTDESGAPLYRYSFGKDFYNPGCEGSGFDAKLLSERFGIYPLESFTFPMKPDRDGIGMHSRRVRSTDRYPLFVIKYEDEQGWWAKKYEPLFREERDERGRSKGNYKFTYWYRDGKPRPDLAHRVYGDTDVMHALQTGIVRTSDEEHPAHNFNVRKGKETFQRYQFDRIIICSGPRDAINVYFHSDAHVVYPHSESTEIPDATLARLFDIAHEVYVLYDIDRTGIEQMHRLAFRNLHLKVIYLPEDLATEVNPRTGKSCKDAEEFFNFYPQVMRRDSRQQYKNVNRRFADLVRTAKWMQFWTEAYSQPKGADGKKVEDVIIKYTLNFETMSQFLSANGFYCYEDDTHNTKFVIVRNNIVDIVNPDEAMTAARTIMKEFIEYNSEYYREDLANAIAMQRKVTNDIMRGIRKIDLDFRSWTEDEEYFFFRNTAVRVTGDDIRCVAYKDLPFQVNRLSIMDFDYHPSQVQRLFEITENPAYLKEKEYYEADMANLATDTDDKAKRSIDFSAYERLWRYTLRFTDDIDKMPPTTQYLYDTSRIHWRKEESGMPLLPEEKQRQDMHFINKVNAIGYVLSRYRTMAMQKMVVFTDYSVQSEAKSSGGTGKSIVRSLLEQVRKVRGVDGQSYKRKENAPKNFQQYQDTVESLFFVDDLRGDIVDEEFYNVTDRITVKSLYNNEITLPPERTPKMFITTNKASFNLDNPSTARRLIVGWASDYYHPASLTGRQRLRTPETKFGKDIIQGATPAERLATVQLMLQCCQFYLRTKADVVAPLEDDGRRRVAYSAIKDEVFIDWANRFFQNPWHFLRPIARKEMVAAYLYSIGQDVTDINIRRESSTAGGFFAKLQTYCDNMDYVINPPIVFRADRNSKYPRRYAWVTPQNGGRYRMDDPRSITPNQECMFFYRTGEVPRDAAELLQVEETDREMEWERENE